jgi:hypothetical protein
MSARREKPLNIKAAPPLANAALNKKLRRFIKLRLVSLFPITV